MQRTTPSNQAVAIRARRRRLVRALALTGAAGLALPVAVATSASAAPAALRITSSVGVTGLPPAGLESPVIAAEAPDGAVYVASITGGKQTVWDSPLAGKAHIADRVTGVGVITAIAADASYLYVGTAKSVTSYRRTNGALTHRWTFKSQQSVSQVAVAGDRVWALLTVAGNVSGPSALAEFDPSSAVRVRAVNGLVDTYAIAPTSTGVDYVTARSSTIVHLGNDGTRTTAKTHLTVNQTLSGPAAIQAELVHGNTLLLSFAAGQGLDASLFGYNATTLAGPGKPADFSAVSLLGNTSLGLLDTPGAGIVGCKSPINQCIVRYGSTGSVGAALTLPYSETSGPLGPFPAVVGVSKAVLHVVRIG